MAIIEEGGYPLDESKMSIQKITLEYLSFAIQRYFSDLPSIRLGHDTWLKSETMDMVASLRADILSHKTIEKTCPVNFEYPATWWQMFKYQYAPEWFKERYPVRMKTEIRAATFEEYDTYPKATISVPEARFGVAVMKQMWK